MLQSLFIRNIALIDQLSITFHEGLQVLTGETGAGKSIVMDAVNLILGGRADRTLIRTGCERASVEAVFDISENQTIASVLEREGIEFDGRTVPVFREISTNGRNICRVCGTIMPISFLKELSPLLMNLHGQSEHQFLTDNETHLRYLDHLGNPEHAVLLMKVREAYHEFLSNHRTYASLVKQSKDKEAKIDRISRDLEELQKAALKPGEEENLKQEMKRLEKAGRINQGLKGAYGFLMNGEGGNGALPLIRETINQLKSVSGQDEQAEELRSRCENIYYETEDIAYQLNSMIGKNDFDSSRMEQIENRLELIARIEKRFGVFSVNDVLKKGEELTEEYDLLIGMDEKIKQMGGEHKRLLAAYRRAARELTESRKKLAQWFSECMMKELRDLGMEKTVFAVHFEDNESGKPKMPTEEGDDQVRFMISTNPGEPLMPLDKIASGGELSRLMLAIKTLEAGHTGVDCMVFDEIDTGISGKAAQTVAEKLISISRYHQVICVSHLPQLAAAGDYQYLVSKHVADNRTNTTVTELNRDGRIGDIGRMISGAEGISEEAKHYAEQMLNASLNRKR